MALSNIPYISKKKRGGLGAEFTVRADKIPRVPRLGDAIMFDNVAYVARGVESIILRGRQHYTILVRTDHEEAKP